MLRYNTRLSAFKSGAFRRGGGFSDLNSSLHSILNLARGRSSTSQHTPIGVETVTSSTVDPNSTNKEDAPPPIGSASRMSPIDPLSQSDQTTLSSTQTNVYRAFFSDTFNFAYRSNIPIVTAPTITHDNTKSTKALDDSDKIEFEPQENSNDNDTSESMVGIETIRSLFNLFG
jgi:hypothetical protein